MAEFHFVEDYERFVRSLMRSHDIDTAMSMAVGGAYTDVGNIETDILQYAGLSNGMVLFDLGCGSGRLSSTISKRMRINFTGSDVVKDLLDYARGRAPDSYRFLLHRDLSIPMESGSCNFVSAFSVFTHLLHEETFIYLEDIFRCLCPGGTLVFSFLEFGQPTHWAVFEATVSAKKASAMPPLNQFIERSVIAQWGRHIGFEIVSLYGGLEAPWSSGARLGQSVAILRKPV